MKEILKEKLQEYQDRLDKVRNNIYTLEQEYGDGEIYQSVYDEELQGYEEERDELYTMIADIEEELLTPKN